MNQECTCQSFNIGGIIQHQADCESWNDPKCEFCGAEVKELIKVTYKGGRLNVCSACNDNIFKYA